jgi:hypothetical protein
MSEIVSESLRSTFIVSILDSGDMLIQRMCPIITGKSSCSQIVLGIVHKIVPEIVLKIGPQIVTEIVLKIISEIVH